MKCPSCKSFDDQTINLVRQLFSPDEVFLLSSMLSHSISLFGEQAKKLKTLDPKRLNMIRQSDINAQVLGKFLICLDNKRIEGLQKQFNLNFNIQHEKCPHEPGGNT